MSGYLLLIIIGGILVYLFGRSKPSADEDQQVLEQALRERNQQWIDFISLYDTVAKTDAQKQLIRHMLFDIRTQGLGDSPLADEYKHSAATVQAAATTEAEMLEAQASEDAGLTDFVDTQDTSEPKVQLDNTSLLLYFGAFLFVASVGLFVTLGTANGSLRSMAVLLVMAVMYGGGVWIFKTQSKLEQAGVAFAGIGIVMAPLVGLAFYNYVFTQQHGPAIWFVTSLLCLALYLHALTTLRKPLISYILIFTFLSLFESGVSIANSPVYYFGWGLAFVGIALQLASRWGGYWADLRESSRYSSQVFLPVALLASLAMVQVQGIGQLGVSLLLAAAFYGLEALSTRDAEQETNAIIAQASLIAAVGCLLYAITSNMVAVVVGIVAVNALQALIMTAQAAHSRLWLNFGSVMLAAALVDGMPSLTHPRSLFVATLGLLLTASLLWWRQRRADAYGLAALALLGLPYEYGQILSDPQLRPSTQTLLGYGVLLIVLLAYRLSYARAHESVRYWHDSARASYLLGALAVIGASLFGSPWLCLAACGAVAATTLLLAEFEHDLDWAEVGAIIMLLPLMRGWDNHAVLLTANVIAWVLYIGLALRCRRDFFRWGSTLLWLLLPVSLGHGVLGSVWTAADYTWAYMVAMAGLIASRAIARGQLLFSSKSPLSTYTRTASYSYVVGYTSAGLIALGLSLSTDDSRLHTSLVLAVLLAVVSFLAAKIEKRADILVLLPLLSQALLLSVLRPALDTPAFGLYLTLSTGLAAASYILAEGLQPHAPKQSAIDYLQQAVLVTGFVTPLAGILGGFDHWQMANGLLITGLLLSHYLHEARQDNRELAGGVISASLLWFLGVAGVHQLQAYVHVIAFTLAFYAGWRNERGEYAQSQQYLQATLFVATVPLALQALGGPAGGVYGWWLLLEQIVIMLLGMTIKSRLATLWGLYVAVGAVLLQLRNLGWAALTVLALFLIGLAVYRLEHHDNPKQ